MAERFTEEEIEAFKSAFHLLDKEENGLLPFKSIGILLRSVGENPTDSKIGEIINDLHVANNYVRGPWIDFTDFLLMLSKLRHNDKGDDIEEVFNVFDQEGTGFMKTDELRAVLEFLKDDVLQEDIPEMLADFDMDEDGKIRFDEFETIMGFNARSRSAEASGSEAGSSNQ